MLRSGKPKKLRDGDLQVLSKEIQKNRMKSMAHILQKFQQAPETVVLINTIRMETHLLSFHGLASTHKPLITKSSRAARLRCCKARRNWTVNEWKSVLWSDEFKIKSIPVRWQSLVLDRLLAGASNGDINIYTMDINSDSIHPDCMHPRKIFGRRSSRNKEYKIVQWHTFEPNKVVATDRDRRIHIWDAIQDSNAETKMRFDINIAGFHMSSGATKIIAVARKDPLIELIDIRSPPISRFSLHASSTAVSSVRWSPKSDEVIASGSVDGNIYLWDIRFPVESLGDRLEKDSTTAHGGAVDCLRFTNDGLYIVSHGLDNRINVWDATSGKPFDVDFGAIPSARTSYPVLIDMCYDSKPPVLFVPSRDCIIMYNLFTGDRLKTLMGHTNFVSCCAYRSSSNELFSAGRDKKILLWTPGAEIELEE
ncbi:DNA excision repair protein ERCC-8-like [Argiope bruennichi]|uniref:DNA excision repair protein ERCC-8-like n=1 Tax=Argiope bruennichi TaxID=94029 RepID=UPI0024944E3C|nr:DNA excision repair protein ERCC-8-like [Argiope bruennichi]